MRTNSHHELQCTDMSCQLRLQHQVFANEPSSEIKHNQVYVCYAIGLVSRSNGSRESELSFPMSWDIEGRVVGKLITDNQVCGHKLNLAGHHGLLVSYSWFELMVSLWTDLFPSIITIRFVSPNKLVLGYSTVLCSVINFLSLT